MLLVECYNDKQNDQWYHTRFIAYANYCASWANPKKRPMSINKYMPIDDTDEYINDEAIERMLKNFEIARITYQSKILEKKKEWQQN